jgi:Fe2+ transport system protein FeoA
VEIVGVMGMTLDKVNRGEKLRILHIPDDKIRLQAIRLGVCEGAMLTCSIKLPKGPIVLQNRMQEIAIGRKLAEQIEVENL